MVFKSGVSSSLGTKSSKELERGAGEGMSELGSADADELKNRKQRYTRKRKRRIKINVLCSIDP